LIAFVGTVNPTSGDASIFLQLEQAALTQAVEPRRTAASLTAVPKTFALNTSSDGALILAELASRPHFNACRLLHGSACLPKRLERRTAPRSMGWHDPTVRS
jgi:hypothetical protein